MKSELYWLSWVLGLSAIMWMPYVLNGMVKRGIPEMLGYPENPKPLSAWAERAKKAHANSNENLVLFAPAVLLYLYASQGQGESLGWAVMIYFFARLTHYLVYVFKIPVVRTLSFLVGWGMTVFILCKSCQWLG